MDFDDLDEARAVHGALLEVLAAHTGGKDNPAALGRVERLCDLAIRSVDDLECRVALRGIRSYASLLFSDDGHLGIDSGSISGLDFLRLRISNELSALRGRLSAIEAERLRQQMLAFERQRRRPPEPRALTDEKFEAPHQERNVKVLVVEDNRDAAESLRRLLDLSGYEVSLAHTGEEGLRAAKRLRPDVVLCDIGLPDSNGFAVAGALRNDPETAGARLIAVTAYGADEDRRRARAVGFDLHLVKPVDPEVLLDKLEQQPC
jgi:CheY-like chemotaxis protein